MVISNVRDNFQFTLNCIFLLSFLHHTTTNGEAHEWVGLIPSSHAILMTLDVDWLSHC